MAKGDDVSKHRKAALQLEFSKAIEKREKRIINKAVGKYRDDLTPEEAFAIIASIAELRSTVNEIE